MRQSPWGNGIVRRTGGRGQGRGRHDVASSQEVPVILTSTMDAPGRDREGYDAAYGRAAQLYQAASCAARCSR